ncbi:hypothetical protein [Shimazuella kribbensis]|uniref:hypothetical protein n=1 Tax=Shimazuella kribbensis TaxID=139808 RepID=UPI000429CA01|nr:hypothetical protein [Shimazuella kribbensis]
MSFSAADALAHCRSEIKLSKFVLLLLKLFSPIATLLRCDVWMMKQKEEWTAYLRRQEKQLEEYLEFMSGKRNVPSTSEVTMGQFRKKVFDIEAVQYTGSNLDEIKEFVGQENFKSEGGRYYIVTLEGDKILEDQDYVIKGVGGEFYPVPAFVIAERYDWKGGIKYRKKPILVEAIKYTGDNLDQVNEFSNGSVVVVDGKPYIGHHKGDNLIRVNDYVLPNAGTNGFFVHEGELFEKTHDPVK